MPSTLVAPGCVFPDVLDSMTACSNARCNYLVPECPQLTRNLRAVKVQEGYGSEVTAVLSVTGCLVKEIAAVLQTRGCMC